MAKFDPEQLAQLRAIQEGERFHTEQLIKKHTAPILKKITEVQNVQLEDRKDAREDVDSVVTQYVQLETRVKRVEKVHELETVSVK